MDWTAGRVTQGPLVMNKSEQYVLTAVQKALTGRRLTGKGVDRGFKRHDALCVMNRLDAQSILVECVCST